MSVFRTLLEMVVAEVPAILAQPPHSALLLAEVAGDLRIPRSWVTEEIIGDDVEVIHVLLILLF